MNANASSGAKPPEFDPTAARVVCEPAGREAGYWVGAPGVYLDPESQDVFLSYRVRRPRGVEPDRGAETVLARSSDGLRFETIWTGHKAELSTASIERSAIGRLDDGSWVLTISYVDAADGRWRIDTVRADRPDGFDLKNAQPALLPADLVVDGRQVEGVKDPYIFMLGGMRHMLASFATATVDSNASELHGTLDAYNTGRIRSATGLAVSPDGLRWQWLGEVLGPSDDQQGSWHGYCQRIGCLLRRDGVWLGLYDGSAGVEENYEERLGVAYSHDLKSFQSTTPLQPWLTTPQGAGALRYFDALVHQGRELLYFEMAQPEGYHDLRVIELSS